jgi:ATP-binding cassette subfamily B protein
MKKLTQGRTNFQIAHRLSTIFDSDLILVLKDGDLVEQGSHDQLMEMGGVYADLYNSQFA